MSELMSVSQKAYVIDVLERAVNTLWQAALGGAFAAAASLQDWSDVRVLGAAMLSGAVGAAGSVAKGMLARFRGLEHSASLSRRV